MKPEGISEYPTHDRLGHNGTIDDTSGYDCEALHPESRPEVITAHSIAEQYRQAAEHIEHYARELDRLVPPERRTSLHYRAKGLASRAAEMYGDAAEVGHD